MGEVDFGAGQELPLAAAVDRAGAMLVKEEASGYKRGYGIAHSVDSKWMRLVETSPNRWLWDRALVRDPSAEYRFEPQGLQEERLVSEDEQPVLTGDVATDGSRIGDGVDLGATGYSCIAMSQRSMQGAVVL